MIVIDSSALIAILRREPEADAFIRIVSDADRRFVCSVSLLETSMVVAGGTGDAGSWVALDAMIARSGCEIVAQDEAQVAAARHAFLRFGKGRHPAGLNLGDCASYALAKILSLPLLFKGDAFARTDLSAAV